MDEQKLESQIAKIQLGNPKESSGFVEVIAEKAAGSDAELYMIAELTILNPAAVESCEKITSSIASTLRRVYRKSLGENTFEMAVSQINEELSKLASTGQTNWINKLNSVVSVKEGETLHIATCGKMAAYLLRNDELADISCSAEKTHPLKTFENFASGKIKLDDLVIFSNIQLLNHLSLDRLKNILLSGSFLAATQTIIELLKSNAGPEVAFGAIFNLQVPLGEASGEEIDLENYIVEHHGRVGLKEKTFSFFKGLLAMDKLRRLPKVNLPKISAAGISEATRNLKKSGGDKFSRIKTGLQQSKELFNINKFKGLSPQKKLFLISVAVLFVASVVNIFLAGHYKSSKDRQQQVDQSLDRVQNLLENTESALVYSDQAAAISYLKEAALQIPKTEMNQKQAERMDQYAKKLAEAQSKIEKITEVSPEALGSLGNGQVLIDLPEYFATQKNGQIVSYNKTTKNVQDGLLKFEAGNMEASVLAGNSAVVYTGKSLLVWDYKLGNTGEAFSISVPGFEDAAGLAYYPTNRRVYMVNKKTKQIINYSVGASEVSKPVVSLKDQAELETAQDLALDGSVYILYKDGVSKYLAGKPAEYNMPFLFQSFSGQGRLETRPDFENVYILDKGNKRVIITDKKGNLIKTLVSGTFTKPEDFSVDEKNRVIYLLDDSQLLKFGF
jgi:hypothetical protein